jgi:hypothetical protein
LARLNSGVTILAWLFHFEVSILPLNSELTITSVMLKGEELQVFLLSIGERGQGKL